MESRGSSPHRTRRPVLHRTDSEHAVDRLVSAPWSEGAQPVVDQFVNARAPREREERAARLLLRCVASTRIEPSMWPTIGRAVDAACEGGGHSPPDAPGTTVLAALRASLRTLAALYARHLYEALAGLDEPDADLDEPMPRAVRDIQQMLEQRGGLDDLLSLGPSLGLMVGARAAQLERAWCERLGVLAGHL